jgi:arabinan endo-1,5-alpha-L-arabinosidase
MLQGGGKMVINAGDRKTGPGHFGRTIIADGVEVMSCHYEADYDLSGRSTLGIRPLLWVKDWPVAGDRLREGTYEIESERRGYALELAVDFVRQEVARQRHWGMDPNEKIKKLPEQTLADVQQGWPQGDIAVRAGDYMFRPHQKWTITAVPEAGGYLSNPYFKITIAGTNRALSVSEDCELTTVAEYTGAQEQLWRIEQCTDGTFRIMPKRLPGSAADNTEYVLYSVADSTPILAKWDFSSDNSKWKLKNAAQ